jgi:ligand-binding SRPBCC domain-containing protein
MVRGAFASLEHDHHFESRPDGSTEMVDVLRFAAPFGLVGWLTERVLLGRYLRAFLRARCLVLKSLAETEGWRDYLPAD